MTKYIYLFYILLGVCLLAGFGSAFGSGQEHDVVRTVDLENSAVALCNISESNNGQEKKEINNESYHFYKVGIGGAATSFSFRQGLFFYALYFFCFYIFIMGTGVDACSF